MLSTVRFATTWVLRSLAPAFLRDWIAGHFTPLGRTEFTQQLLICEGVGNDEELPMALGPEASHEHAWHILPHGSTAYVKVAPLERPVNTGRFMRVRVTLRTLGGDAWCVARPAVSDTAL